MKPSVAIPPVLAVALPAGACMKPAVKTAPKPVYISAEQNGAIHISDKPDAAPDSGDPK